VAIRDSSHTDALFVSVWLSDDRWLAEGLTNERLVKFTRERGIKWLLVVSLGAFEARKTAWFRRGQPINGPRLPERAR
jgi:hypothetical protein